MLKNSYIVDKCGILNERAVIPIVMYSLYDVEKITKVYYWVSQFLVLKIYKS